MHVNYITHMYEEQNKNPHYSTTLAFHGEFLVFQFVNRSFDLVSNPISQIAIVFNQEAL